MPNEILGLDDDTQRPEERLSAPASAILSKFMHTIGDVRARLSEVSRSGSTNRRASLFRMPDNWREPPEDE